MFAGNVLFKKLSLSITVLFVIFIAQSVTREDEVDTSLYDFVAMGFLEDYVDILEMISWLGRRVRDNIDENVENAFELLAKQQDLLQPYLDTATRLNKTECTDEKLMSISDIIFKEYFNINMNCPRVQQKMAVFFNEMHNVTSRVTEIHRRYINGAGGCGPPLNPTPMIDRECLQRLVNSGKKEIEVIRSHIFNLSADIEEFMDAQVDETRSCLLRGMSNVRNATKRAAHAIECCLTDDHGEFEERSFRFPSQHPYLELPVEKGPFDGLNFSREDETPPAPPPPPPADAVGNTHPPVQIPQHPGAFPAPHPVQNPQPYPADHNVRYPGALPPPANAVPSPPAHQPAQPESPAWRKDTRQDKDFMNRRKAGVDEFGDFPDFDDDDLDYDFKGGAGTEHSGNILDMYDDMNRVADELEKFYGLKDEDKDNNNK